MKTLKLLALASAFLFVCAGMTSCNKDNGGKDADQVVGKFEIKDASSPVKCIELTSDGEYIVTKNPVITRSDDDLDLDDVWVYGKFTFVDGAYMLQGFGKIVIDMLSGGAADVTIAGGGWDPFTVHADLASTVQKTEINRALCRHWVFDRTTFSLSFSDLPLLNFEFDVDGCDFTQWFQKTGDKEGEEELDKKCTGIIFTESGTYAQCRYLGLGKQRGRLPQMRMEQPVPVFLQGLPLPRLPRCGCRRGRPCHLHHRPFL